MASLASFQFSNNLTYTEQVLNIKSYNSATETYAIESFDPAVDKRINTWNCPLNYFATFIRNYFDLLLMDTKAPNGFQMDCLMMPSPIIRMSPTNRTNMNKALDIMLDMLEMFASKGVPNNGK